MLAAPRLRLLLLAVALVAVHGCQDVSVTEVDVASISVSPGTATLLPNEATSLSATARDASGAALSNRAIAWRSDNTAVASVDASGRVQAHAAGTSRIEASSGGVVGTAVITVSPAPRIDLSRSEVAFGGVSGGNPSPAEGVQISNGGGGSLTGLRIEVDYASGQPGGWLDADLQGSAAPTSLSLRALPQALSSGVYAAAVRVIAPGATNSPQTVQVTLQVEEAAPVVRVSPEALGFSTSEGQGAPPSQVVSVTNSGGGALTDLSTSVSYAGGSPTGWLSAELNRTTAPAEILLRVDPAGLSTGVFDATVQVTSPNAPGEGAAIQVRLRFGDPPPQIEVAPGSVQTSMEEGLPVPRILPVQVSNAGSGALGGLSAQVQYTNPAATGWLQANLRSSSAPTVLDIQFSTTNLLPGNYGAQVVVASPNAINSPVTVPVQLVVQPRPSAATSTVTATPDTIVANGTSSSEILVTLNDPRGNPMPSGGDSVQVFTTAGTLSAVSSLGNGRYRATLVSSSTVETATVTARVRGEAIADAATVHFRAMGPDAGASSVSASPTSVALGATSTVTVQLRDAAGNPVARSGDAVFLATTQGTLTPASGTTTAGVFETSFSSGTAGTATITAYLGTDTSAPQIGTATVTVQPPAGPGPPDAGQSTVDASPTAVAIGANATVTVQLRDAAGTPITASGDEIFLATSLGSVAPNRGTTTNGVFTATFSSSTAGTATIRAYLGANASGPQIGTATVTVQPPAGPGPPDAGQSTVVASPTTVAIGANSVVTVQLKDAAGNPITASGDDVTLATSLGSLTPENGTTTSGVFTSTFSSTTAGTATITAYLGTDTSAPQIGTATVTVQPPAGPAPPDAGESTVEATPTTVAIGANSVVTVQLKDAAGTPITASGDDVTLATSLGSLAPESGTTTSGVFTSTFSSTTAGTATITAHLGADTSGPQIGTATVTVEPPAGPAPPDAGQSRVITSPTTVEADSASTVTVELRDAAGNPVTRSGDAVFLFTDLGEITPASGTSTAGVFQASFSSGTAGTATITAYLGTDGSAPQIGTASITVVAGEPDPGQSELETGSGSSEMPADGSLTVRVQLRDAAGNNVTESGDPIFLTTDLGELEPVSGPTTEGRFESVFTSSETGTATIAAYLGNDESGEAIGTLSVAVGERTPDPGASVITSDQTHIGRNGSANIQVELRDAAGEPLTSSGTPIFLTTSRGQANPSSGTTTNGVFTSVFSSNQTGNTVITAYLGENDQAPVIGSVSVVVQGGSGDETGEMSADTLAMTTDESLTVRIRLRDADGNPLPTSGTEISLVTTMGVLEPSSGVTTEGEFSATFRSSATGIATISAFLGDPELGALLDQLQITVAPGALSAAGSTVEASPGEVGIGEPATLTVQLRDAAGNPVAIAGQGIVLATTGGELSATSGATDSNGRWTTTLLLSEAPESATVTAYLVDGDEQVLIGSVVVTTSNVTAVESGAEHE